MENLKVLREKYSNTNTYYKKIVELINETKPLKSTKKNEANLRLYRDELVRIKIARESELLKQQASQKEKDNYMSLEDMRKHWHTMPDDENKLILGFFLYYPAMRSDFCNVKIENNEFTFNKILKNPSITNYKLPIVPELKHLIQFVDEIPRVAATFTKRLINTTKREFGKSIGINMFRKIWVFENKNSSEYDRINLAKSMGHTVQTSRMYYQKNDLDTRKRPRSATPPPIPSRNSEAFQTARKK